MNTIASITRVSMIVAALAIAGCTETTLNSAGIKANKELPDQILASMKAKGMEKNAPVMARVFKEEGKLEIWKRKTSGRYDLIATYDICKWSGKLGPKFIEGDRQAPEGFYNVRPSQLNPQSSYHLAFNMGYPNAYDRAHGRTGSNLMVHGACSSSGCYSMTDAQVEEIYAFARDAFRGGQTEFQIQAFPFRMTPENMARYKDDPNYEFWKMLKEGYDHFEITKVPPKVDVCEKRYVFNRIPEGSASFSPTGACPPMSQPEALMTAYQSYQTQFDSAFASYANRRASIPPRPTIAGLQEARLVSEWSKKRARGERVTMEPPSLASDGSVVSTTAQMGRIDSPAGRRMAEIEASEAAKRKAEEEKKAALALKAAEAEAAKVAAVQAAKAAETAAAEPAPAETVETDTTGSGLFGAVRKRVGAIGNLFGG